MPPDDFYAFHIGLIKHGRRICTAQRPRCPDCVLNDLCPSAVKFHPELRRRRTVAAFFAGYLALWTGFFAVFALADGMAHALLGPGSAVAPSAYLITGVAVALAAGWQLTTAKRKLLNACRRVDLLPAHGRQADLAAVRLGLLQGAFCVGSCGPLMLAMLAAASGRLALMVLIAVLAWLEKATRTGRRLARPSAAVLAAIALTYGLAGLSALAAQHG